MLEKPLTHRDVLKFHHIIKISISAPQHAKKSSKDSEIQLKYYVNRQKSIRNDYQINTTYSIKFKFLFKHSYS